MRILIMLAIGTGLSSISQRGALVVWPDVLPHPAHP
jgi:hypothetical protein